MYKIFVTFIDDAYSFMVQMPLKHKIMTLRDDVVFLGFLYQWWIYPADTSRPNEFGFLYATGKEDNDPVDTIWEKGTSRNGVSLISLTNE